MGLPLASQRQEAIGSCRAAQPPEAFEATFERGFETHARQDCHSRAGLRLV